MRSAYLLFIFTIYCTQQSFAQTTFTPNQEEYLSLEDWKNEENWTYVEGDKNNNWPSDKDVILVNNTKLKLEYLKIDFDLDEISSQLTYALIRQNFRLEIGKNGSASFKIVLQGNVTTGFDVDGELNIKEGVAFDGSLIKFNVNGTLNVENDLTFNNANNQFVVNEGGVSKIGGDLNSLNGGNSTYYSDGELVIDGDFRNEGKAILEIGEHGNGRIKGNVTSDNGGGGTINVYGILLIEQSVDFFGKETIYVDETGCLIISGNVFLTCNKNINPTINGKLQFGPDTKCTISDDSKCRENSPNNQICKLINEEDLPVELTQFYGVASSGRNTLYWETATEINNKHFEIQNSVNNDLWVTIDTVKGAGNISTPTSYSYVDSISLLPYYRLKQVDFDGNSTIYGPINISNNSGQISARMYPNVVTKGTNIKIEIFGVKTNQTVKAFIISSSGKIMDEIILTVDLEGDFITSYTLPQSPPVGIYVFRVITVDEAVDMKFYVY
ncbi:hypothetical protein [Flammeovirga sp. SJP92]|uniref:hypothetical protein n=1 Tax=Flammeovirga sp. SJP92 TaxID=1775430 RepID=UPI00078930EF|nr:hypothetical protein [Flammeovirga sp. SJP92]KXX70533.1 hypothetical protein AVL50_08530 [Flammeovirga sp. SJP92]